MGISKPCEASAATSRGKRASSCAPVGACPMRSSILLAIHAACARNGGMSVFTLLPCDPDRKRARQRPLRRLRPQWVAPGPPDCVPAGAFGQIEIPDRRGTPPQCALHQSGSGPPWGHACAVAWQSLRRSPRTQAAAVLPISADGSAKAEGVSQWTQAARQHTCTTFEESLRPSAELPGERRPHLHDSESSQILRSVAQCFPDKCHFPHEARFRIFYIAFFIGHRTIADEDRGKSPGTFHIVSHQLEQLSLDWL